MKHLIIGLLLPCILLGCKDVKTRMVRSCATCTPESQYFDSGIWRDCKTFYGMSGSILRACRGASR